MVKNIISPYREDSLKELTKSKLNYVLLRKPKLSEPNGDVDILVNDINKAHDLLLNLNYKCFSKDKNNQKYIRYDKTNKKWVHLDIQTNIKLKAFWTPDSFTDQLLDSKEQSSGINFLTPSHEIIITILHAGINKRFYDKEYLERISNFDITKLHKHAIDYSFLPFKFSELLNLVNDFYINKINEKELIHYFKKYFPDQKKSLKNQAFRLVNRINSFFHLKRGVAILGPDGSGKTTLIALLSELQWPSVISQYMGPSSKNDMNKYLNYASKYLSKIRNKYPKETILGLFSRAAWVAICYLDYLERYFRNNWFFGSKGLIVYDRFPCDMYFRNPTILNEIIFLKFFPKPKHVFLCLGDSNIIFERKKELLSPEKVEETILLYKEKLNKYKISFDEIDTTKQSIDVSLNFILKTLIENKFFFHQDLFK